MVTFREVRDAKVRQLAETLKANGLAASESEAIRMAESMVSTEHKVSKQFEEQRESAIMKTRFSHAPQHQPVAQQAAGASSPEEEVKVQQAPERGAAPLHENGAIAEAISNVQQVYEQKAVVPDTPDLPPDKPLSELMHEEASQKGEEVPRVVEQPLPPEEPARPVHEEQPVAPEPAPQEASGSDDGMVERTQEVFDRPPKKDVSSFEESKVDLTDVFNFSKR